MLTAGKYRKNSKLVFSILFILICFVMSKNVKGQFNSFVKLSMQSAVDSAINYNPLLKNAGLSIEIAEGVPLQNTPFGDTEIEFRKGQIHSAGNDYLIELNQDFGSPFAIASANKVQEAKIELAKYQYHLQKTNLIIQVKDIYLQWIYQHNKLNILQEQKQEYDDFLRIVNLHYTLGNINELEKLEAENEFNLLKLEYQTVEQELMIVQMKLKALTGIEDDIFPELEQLEMYMLPPPMDTVRFSPESITQWYQLQYQLQSCTYKYEKANTLPHIEAGLFSQQINSVKGYNGWQVGVSIPLWYSPHASKIKTEKLKSQIKLNELAFAEYAHQQKINELLHLLDKQFIKINYYNTTALPLAQTIVKTANFQLKNEAIEYDKYLEYMRKAYAIKLEYIDAVKEYNSTVIQLEIYVK